MHKISGLKSWIGTILLIIIPLSTSPSNYSLKGTTESEIVLNYKGQGSNHIKKVTPYCIHAGEIIICLVECGSNNNLSGFRKASGDYYTYPDKKSWGKHFRKVMDKKYPRGNETTKQWLTRIAPVYNKPHQKEWLKRCYYWCDIIKL